MSACADAEDAEHNRLALQPMVDRWMTRGLGISELWAVTCYFNPVGYSRRRANYDTFRRCLEVPLVAVELAFGDAPFVLGPSDAERLIQVRGRDILWQKERLLNLALTALPDHCRKVAWIDCDVIFERPDWVANTCDALERYTLVQPFKEFVEVAGPTGRPLAAYRSAAVYSWGHQLATGVDGRELSNLRGTPLRRGSMGGAAWAARRAVLEEHGFYDACIVGSGDRAIACAAFGCFDGAIRPIRMNDARTEHYLSWARPFHQSIRANIGYVDGRLLHLVHGDLRQRRYMERHEGFAQFDFDPASDIAIDAGGCWAWSSHKPAMHRFVAEYFRSRNEDVDLSTP